MFPPIHRKRSHSNSKVGDSTKSSSLNSIIQCYCHQQSEHTKANKTAMTLFFLFKPIASIQKLQIKIWSTRSTCTSQKFCLRWAPKLCYDLHLKWLTRRVEHNQLWVSDANLLFKGSKSQLNRNILSETQRVWWPAKLNKKKGRATDQPTGDHRIWVLPTTLTEEKLNPNRTKYWTNKTTGPSDKNLLKSQASWQAPAAVRQEGWAEWESFRRRQQLPLKYCFQSGNNHLTRTGSHHSTTSRPRST